MTRVRLALLVVLLLAIAAAGVYLSAPAVVQLAERWEVPSDGYLGPEALIVILECSVAAGTLLWLDSALSTGLRATGAGFVIGALAVTLTAGVQAYGPMGLVAPISYGLTAHAIAVALNGTRPRSGKRSPLRLTWQRLTWERDRQPEQERPAMVDLRPLETPATGSGSVERERESATATAIDPAPRHLAPFTVNDATDEDLLARLRAMRGADGTLPSKRQARAELRVKWDRMAPLYEQVQSEKRPT